MCSGNSRSSGFHVDSGGSERERERERNIERERERDREGFHCEPAWCNVVCSKVKSYDGGSQRGRAQYDIRPPNGTTYIFGLQV